VVYSIICHRFGCLYIGGTGGWLWSRFSEHLCSVRNNPPGFPAAEHFNSASHSLNDIMICSLKRCSGDDTCRKNQKTRLIFVFRTLKLNGLNIIFSFVETCTLLLMRTQEKHALTYTFLFHSCVSRPCTLRVSARSPSGFLYGVCQLATRVLFFLHRWRALPETFVHILMFIDTFKSFSLTSYCYYNVTHHFSFFSQSWLIFGILPYLKGQQT